MLELVPYQRVGGNPFSPPSPGYLRTLEKTRGNHFAPKAHPQTRKPADKLVEAVQSSALSAAETFVRLYFRFIVTAPRPLTKVRVALTG